MNKQSVHSTPMFASLRPLIETLNRAVDDSDMVSITEKVSDILADFLQHKKIVFPADFLNPEGEKYTRKQIYSDKSRGYSIFVMIWGPGQKTPLHNHGGVWVVEGVYRGDVHIEQYDLLAQKDDLYHFEKKTVIDSIAGETGHLIPPYDFHIIGNKSQHENCVTIHIYGGDLEDCKIFEDVGGGWYRVIADSFDN